MSFGDNSAQKQFNNYMLHRQRSLPVIQPPVPHSPHPHQPVIAFYQQVVDYRSQMVKSKYPAVELYRPPSVRARLNANRNFNENFFNKQGQRYSNPKNGSSPLNVNAKEFTLPTKSDNVQREGTRVDGGWKNQNNDFQRNSKNLYELNTSKSSGNVVSVLKSCNNIRASHDFSKSNSLQLFNRQSSQNSSPKTVSFDLQKTKSRGNMLLTNQSDISVPKAGNMNLDKKFTSLTVGGNQEEYNGMSGLKRSKSLNSKDAMKVLFEKAGVNFPTKFTEFDSFPADLQPVITQAVKDPGPIPDRYLMALARKVLELGINDRKIAVPAAKLSIVVIEKDKKGTYLDTMLNTCLLWFEERKTRLRSSPNYFTAFMAFLNEFYNQLKRRQLELKFNDASPSNTLLTLLSKCCHDLLTYTDKHTLSEAECLFFVLTSIGRDLENELHSTALQLHNTLRDVFLKSKNSPQIKKTFLQLIELRAAKWQQLPMSALNYYYPKSTGFSTP